MIKLIASDMDGTLLNESSLVSDKNKEAILFAQEQGIEFMVATGRGRMEAYPVLDRVGLHLPMITVNGAQVYDQSGDILFTISFEKDAVETIVSILRKHQLYFELATSQGTYSDSHIRRIQSTTRYIHSNRPYVSPKLAIAMTAAHLEMLNVQFVDDFSGILADKHISILKFIVFSMDEDERLAQAAAEINLLPDLAVTSSAKNNIEINHINAQKGLALKKVAESRGIAMENVMTIGDNFNDISMLEVAGISFAMANGPEEVHKHAKFLAKSNAEDGVADAIYQVIKDQL
ncbi:Cof-type HAD-IIB family hydrolase [Enterococcus timonensis]|uniref:Cof-type HAD-IIB family hydrolase n=1 Tax=Enterococcus timonensis TaxID=1852364 RepID=UPI0008DAE259|nr:Cof-type HAD-IIB family hydrolase [Enterococcus timonensis]